MVSEMEMEMLAFPSMTASSSDEETDFHHELLEMKDSRINNNKVTSREESMNDTVEGENVDDEESSIVHQEGEEEEEALVVGNDGFSEISSSEKAESLNGHQEEEEEALVIEDEVFSVSSSSEKAESLNGHQEEEEDGSLKNKVFSESSSSVVKAEEEEGTLVVHKEEENLGEGFNKSNETFGAGFNIEEDYGQVLAHKRPELQGEIDRYSEAKRSRIVESDSGDSLLGCWMKLSPLVDIQSTEPTWALEHKCVQRYDNLLSFFATKSLRFEQITKYDPESLGNNISTSKFCEGAILRSLVEFGISEDIICQSLFKMRRKGGNNWVHIVLDNTLVPKKFSKELNSGENLIVTRDFHKPLSENEFIVEALKDIQVNLLMDLKFFCLFSNLIFLI